MRQRSSEFCSKDKRHNQVSTSTRDVGLLGWQNLQADAQAQLHAATRGSLKSPISIQTDSRCNTLLAQEYPASFQKDFYKVILSSKFLYWLYRSIFVLKIKVL